MINNDFIMHVYDRDYLFLFDCVHYMTKLVK